MNQLLKNTKDKYTTTFGIISILLSIGYELLFIILKYNKPEFSYEPKTLYFATGFIGGIVFIFSPDTIINRAKKFFSTGAKVVIICIMVSSCKLLTTYPNCVEKFGTVLEDTDTTYAHINDSLLADIRIISKPDSSHFSFNPLTLPVYDTITVETVGGKAQVRYWKDQYDSIQAIVRLPPDTTDYTGIKVHVRDSVPCPPCPPVVKFEEPTPKVPWSRRFRQGFEDVAFGIFGYLLIGLVLYIGVKLLINHLK